MISDFGNYYSYAETPLVTLQIGLTGKDGWLIASDRRQTEIQEGVRVSSNIIKIEIDAKLACACAGDGLSLIARSELLVKSSGLTVNRAALRRELEDFGDWVWNEHHEKREPPYSERWERGLLVGFADLSYPLWRLDIGKKSVVREHPDYGVAGDTVTSALFFYQMHAPTLVGLKQLAFIAAHVITMGAKLNSSGVGGGLDIVVCENRAMRFMEQYEIKELEQKSAALDQLTTDFIGRI